MSIPFGETVTVTRQTVNAYGDHSDGATHTVPDCAVWPSVTTEVIQGQDTVVYGLTVLMPAGSDVLSTDTLTVRGVVYRVTGQPNLYTSPLTGTTSGVEVMLQAATG